MKKVIISAANGFLGKNLVTHLKAKYELVALVRNPKKCKLGVRTHKWDGEHIDEWAQELDGAFAVINLAGRSVDCRYNEKNKEQILQSRLKATSAIGEAIKGCQQKPEVWMNAASATIYRHSLEDPMTEKEGEIGQGFSVSVCKKWEACFNSYEEDGVRKLILRTAIVMGNNGGALMPLKNLAKLGFGGKQGSGEQMMSWIHVDDFNRAVEFLLENKEQEGVFNVASPAPVKNKVFMRELRDSVGRRFGLPISKRLLEIGAVLIRTETELILKSRYVIPERLLHAGFEFHYPLSEDALQDLLAAK